MFRTTLTVLFAALTLSLPAFAQKQDATQTKPIAELKETESTYEEVPVINGTGGTTKPQTGSEAPVLEAAPSTNEPLAYPAKPLAGTVEEPLEFPMTMANDGGLQMELTLEGGILRADVYAAVPKFFAGVLVSLQSETEPMDWLGLSLLKDAVVMGIGFGDSGRLTLELPVGKDLAGMQIFAQAVIADGKEIRAGEVVAVIAQ